ncbi:phage tail protein [Kumtagia ephedrae]|uniref:Phage tail protein n=1 Tax=Kumtagia ephedrae TaxID=2116701 RepID=A0A2P7STA5_9HYPH|nr:tail fiber protein [Mesorhizobium ephedrae]PSJ65700.1 phage tail protein [Mesorhizobium ephedrae]
MSDQFVAEIRIFPFNFPPKGWAFCNGQLMPISQNTALFALLGTTYGGDGKSTFALPNLEGCAAMQPGQGSGLSERFLGEEGGTQSITLLSSEMPAHSHNFMTSNNDAASGTPAGQQFAKGAWDSGSESGRIATYTTNPPDTTFAFQALSIAGGNLPHPNMQPYLTLNYCIALQGIFPQRP